MKLTPTLIKRCHLVAAVMWVILAIPVNLVEKQRPVGHSH